MECVFQNSWFCSVNNTDGGDLLAETTLVGTKLEAAGRLVTDRSTFIIKDAGWEINRSPGGSLNGSGILPGLKGEVAYFDSGAALRREAAGIAGGLARELLAECVRGIIQAETFLYHDRGYPTAEAYGEYWEKFYLDSCRYYSNLQRITRRWPEYVGGYYTGNKLFARGKNCSIFRVAGGYTAAGVFSDSFHEIALNMSLNDEGMVTACRGNFLRAPDPVCFENTASLPVLEGTFLGNTSKKLIAEGIGGPTGCDQLVDMVYALAKAFREALNPA